MAKRRVKEYMEDVHHNGNGHDEFRDKLVDIFANPNEDQLMMTSIIGRGEKYSFAEALMRRKIHDPSRFEFDPKTGRLVNHESLSSIYYNNILKLAMSQGGKNRDYLAYLTEGEIFGDSEEDKQWKQV